MEIGKNAFDVKCSYLLCISHLHYLSVLNNFLSPVPASCLHRDWSSFCEFSCTSIGHKGADYYFQSNSLCESLAEPQYAPADCLLQRNKFETLRSEGRLPIGQNNSSRCKMCNQFQQLDSIRSQQCSDEGCAGRLCCTINSENHSHTSTARAYAHNIVLAQICFGINILFA